MNRSEHPPSTTAEYFSPRYLFAGDQLPRLGILLTAVRDLPNGVRAIITANAVDVGSRVMLLPRHCHLVGIGKVPMTTDEMRWTTGRTFLEAKTTKPITSIGLAEDSLREWSESITIPAY